MRRPGQTMTEFALITPVLLILLLGIFDAGLLMFSVGTASQGVGEGARVGAEAGNASNADSQIVSAIKATALGTTSLVNVTEVDIYHLLQNGGTGALTVDSTGCGGTPGCFNEYDLNGNPLIPVRWASTGRNVTYGQMDFLGVTVKYTYAWKSGILLSTNPLNLSATYYVRLEPQSY